MQAKADLEQARSSARGRHYEWACFAAQQSAEKAVKAVIQARHQEAWGHSVASLLEALGQDVSTSLLDGAKELDKAYVAARYPNAHPEGSPSEVYTKAEADRALAHAEEILRFCKGLLGPQQG